MLGHLALMQILPSKLIHVEHFDGNERNIEVRKDIEVEIHFFYLVVASFSPFLQSHTTMT